MPPIIRPATEGTHATLAEMCIRDRFEDNGDTVMFAPGEPFYPNYNTMAYTCGAKIRPIPTSPHDGYHYADRAKVYIMLLQKYYFHLLLR